MRLLPTFEEVEADSVPKCPDFDADCEDVTDKLCCYLGLPELGLAHGYCPYLVVMATDNER